MKSIPTGGAIARARAASFTALLLAFLASSSGFAADAPTLSEPELKALCVLNFTKYIDWPANAFSSTNDPITVGCVGNGKILDGLKTAVAGRVVDGRKIAVVPAATTESWKKCNVLFVTASEKKKLPEILRAIKDRPVLVVGESAQFLQTGGAINLLTKDGKVRFEIDVDAARAAHLQISSKLLSLADNVQGKP